jgi:hypothetical protein
LERGLRECIRIIHDFICRKKICIQLLFRVVVSGEHFTFYPHAHQPFGTLLPSLTRSLKSESFPCRQVFTDRLILFGGTHIATSSCMAMLRQSSPLGGTHLSDSVKTD